MEILKLPQNLKVRIDDLIRGLKEIYGDGLVSVILYGSAASGEFSKRYSNINLAIFLKDTGLPNLAKISKLINSRRFQLFNPIFLTESYLNDSKDVFPIEFLDMRENRVVLCGRDVFADLKIDNRNLRFQCEQELKAKLINLKRLYLRNINRRALKNVLFRSFTSTLHILRNLLRLKGVVPAYLKEDLLKELNREFGIDTTALNKILIAKSRGSRLNHGEVGSLFVGFVTDLEKISGLVDKLIQ